MVQFQVDELTLRPDWLRRLHLPHTVHDIFRCNHANASSSCSPHPFRPSSHTHILHIQSSRCAHSACSTKTRSVHPTHIRLTSSLSSGSIEVSKHASCVQHAKSHAVDTTETWAQPCCSPSRRSERTCSGSYTTKMMMPFICSYRNKNEDSGAHTQRERTYSTHPLHFRSFLVGGHQEHDFSSQIRNCTRTDTHTLSASRSRREGVP